MQKLINRRKRGFTLIELLVVVLILAILMAVALPLYLSAVQDSERKTCRANLQTIANAVQAYRVKNRLADYSTITVAVLVGASLDLQATPICPTNGTYSLAGAGGAGSPGATYSVKCTNHGKFEPGVDAS